ncbi:MAG TPA: alpha/beta hydrolase [Xanthomonadaceae bacterium]|jgi:hypothetical protein
MARLFSLKRIAIGLVVAIALAYVALCALLYALQGVVLYHPSPLQFEPDAQALTIAGCTGPLRGWVANPDKTDAVIYFGGNGEPVERNVDSFRDLLPDRSVYLVPYRGYGPNAGTPSEQGIEADALAVFDFAHARHARVAVIGRSLGSGVATYVAARRPVERLVLVTPYDSILDIARERYGLFPVSLLLRDRYESWRNAGGIRVPVLAVLGEDDEIIPRASSDNLIAHFPTKPAVVVIPHAGHNNLSNDELYAKSIRDFLREDAAPGPTLSREMERQQPTSPPAPSR